MNKDEFYDYIATDYKQRFKVEMEYKLSKKYYEWWGDLR
jgi:hypothetical protein